MSRVTPIGGTRGSGRPTVTYVDSRGRTHDAIVTGGTGLVNETQTVTVTSATGGTFTLTFGGQTTAPIAFNATAAAVKAALVALSSIGAGNVDATGGPLNTGAVTVEFKGTLGGTNVASLVADGALLTGVGAGVAVGAGVTGSVSTVLNLRVPHLPVASRLKTGIAKRTTVAATNVWY